MTIVRWICAASVLIALATGAAAAPLTDKQINGFLNSFPELRTYAERNHLAFERSNRKSMGGNPYAEGIAQLKAAGHYGAASRIVGRHGFSSLEGWSDVANRVMRAYVGAEIGARQPQISAQLQQAMRMIESNPNLSAEQKRLALQQMGASMRSMQEVHDVDPADTRAVGPYRDRIEALMTSMGTQRPPR